MRMGIPQLLDSRGFPRLKRAPEPHGDVPSLMGCPSLAWLNLIGMAQPHLHGSTSFGSAWAWGFRMGHAAPSSISLASRSAARSRIASAAAIWVL